MREKILVYLTPESAVLGEGNAIGHTHADCVVLRGEKVPTEAYLGETKKGQRTSLYFQDGSRIGVLCRQCQARSARRRIHE